MARRIKPLTFAGSAALAFVGLLVFAPLAALWFKAEGAGALSRADISAIRFTLFQAFLSAFLSILLAIPTARALSRRRFRGRGLLVTLLGAPFLLPVIVAVLGILAVWGRAGVVSGLLSAIDIGPLNIYGLSGILLAHVFFNLPLATRLILQGWSGIPAEHFRLAAQLNMRPRDIFRQIEIPMLKGILPGAFLLIFLLCVTSFAVALTLGGGPQATTIELAIYQALRFDFNLGQAALLGLVQFAICALVVAASLKLSVQADFGGTLGGYIRRFDAKTGWMLWQDRLVLVAVTLFLGAPMLAVVWRGFPRLFHLPAALWPAIFNSLLVALASAFLALGLALVLAGFIDTLKTNRPKAGKLAESLGLMTLAISPFVLGTGLFLLIYPRANPFTLALPVTALVMAAVSLPVALRSLLPAFAQNRLAYGQLADSLGMSGLSRFRLFLWPAIRKPAGFATGLAAALSMGDLGVITLFAPPDVETLPLLMYRLMGAYRMEDAASVALVLVALTLLVFWAFDKGGRLGHHA